MGVSPTVKPCIKCGATDRYNNKAKACRPCALLRTQNYNKQNPEKKKAAAVEDKWGAFCDLSFTDGKSNDGAAVLDDHAFWWHGTAFGDGVYVSSQNDFGDAYDFGVDAGLIGIIPTALVGRGVGTGGIFIDFPKAVTCSYDDGTFYFISDGKSLVIPTDLEYDEYEDGDAYDYDN